MAGAEGLKPSPAAGDLAEPVDAWRNWLKSERRAASLSLEAYERDLFAFLAFLAEYQGAAALAAEPAGSRPRRSARLAGRTRRPRPQGDIDGARPQRDPGILPLPRAPRPGGERRRAGAAQSQAAASRCPSALSEAEAMDALDNIGELEGEPWIAKRDTALLTLLYGCGLRLGEALSLTRADVKAARGGPPHRHRQGAQAARGAGAGDRGGRPRRLSRRLPLQA